MNDLIGQLIELLTTSNVAMPILAGAVQSIISIIKGVTGKGPSGPELADMIAAQLRANQKFGEDEINRLHELIANPPPTT